MHRLSGLGRVVSVIVAVVVATLVIAAQTTAATPTVTEFSQGISQGGAADGVTNGPDGNIWFVEPGTDRIGRITPAGVVTEFSAGISANAGLTDITRGSDGNLWFTEAAADKIGRITTAGVVTQFSAGITGGATPTAIAAGPDGRVWFTENGIDKIGAITTTGTPGTVTEFGAGISAGADLTDIASGGGNASTGVLFFTERGIDKIGRITVGGAVSQLAAPISAGAQPTGLTLGRDSNVWFTEPGINAIGRMPPDGGKVAEFSTGISDAAEPFAIASAADGNLWFTERAGNRIARIKLNGNVAEFATGITAGAVPSAITSGPNGNLWFAEPGLDRIAKITTSLDPPAIENESPIQIPASPGTQGIANPYPSTINVNSLPGRRIRNVRVTLTQLSHTFTNDLNVLVQGPQGQHVALLANVGGGTGGAGINGGTVAFNDQASVPAPTPLVGGEFLPTSNGAFAGPAPAPPAPHANSLAPFVNTAPNGIWKLFVFDTAPGDSGEMAGGWGLDLETEAVPVPTLVALLPGSPANANTVTVFGVSEAGSTVNLFSNSSCTGKPLVTGTSSTFRDPGLAIPVADDSSTPIFGAITDRFGNRSLCSAQPLTYVEDSTAPATPTLTATDPHSPAPSNHPLVLGNAEPGSTVDLFDHADCTAPAIGSGTAAELAGGGIEVTVADDLATHIFARATDQAGNVSGCSPGLLYVEDSTPPETLLTKTPKPTVTLRKGKKASVSFEFQADEAGASFRCSIDGKAAQPCTSPASFQAKKGGHSFSVTATSHGLSDGTPARFVFEVKKKKK
jgi:streptogramin lyase/subtilisin-like proprotein convertase family protein